MSKNLVEQFAGWKACGHFFAGLPDDMPEGFNLTEILENYVEGGELPEGWLVWEPFEDSDREDFADNVEALKDSYVEFYRNIVGQGSYFAADGSYGDAKHLAIVDTSGWSEDDWEEIEETSDWERPDVAETIAARYS